jgi:hypothetical protein
MVGGVKFNQAYEPNGVFLSTDLPVGLPLRIPVKSRHQKYFALSETRSAVSIPVPRSIQRALRGRHERWVRDAMDVRAAVDERG